MTAKLAKPKSSNNTVSLAELAPRVGERVRVELQSPRKRFTTELLGFKEGVSVMVAAPRRGDHYMGNYIEGSVVTVHLMAGNRVCAFASRLLKVVHQPFSHWHLAYPQRIEARQLRQYQRIPVNLRVSLDHQDETRADQLGLPKLGHCTDISLTGLSVETDCQLGELDERYFVTLRLAVAGLDQVLLVPVKLCSISPLEPGVYKHGLAFESLDEDTRLILTGFVYQQFLSELGYLDE